MARRCAVTGKGTRSGKQIARRGLPKKKGGVGLKTTGHTLRKFKANIQKVRVVLPDGTVKRIKLSTTALKRGLVPVTQGDGVRLVPMIKAIRGRNRAHLKTA